MSEATFECAEERRRLGSSIIPIKDEHFKSALNKISPSVTNKVILVLLMHMLLVTPSPTHLHVFGCSKENITRFCRKA